MTFRAGPPLLYLSTAGGLGLTTRALLGHPPSLPLALGFFGCYLGLLLLGMASPRLEMWGEIVCSVPGARGLAITIEIHEESGLASALAALRSHRAKATLFVPCALAEKLGPALREALQQGHDVGLLAPTERGFFLRRPEVIHDELARGVEQLQEAIGVRPWLLRCPGWVSPRLLRVASELELTPVGWSSRGPAGLRDGVVVRARCAGGEYPDLPDILAAAARSNTEILPISELLPG